MTPDSSTQELLIGRPDLDRLTTAAFIGAVGVMLALCAATLLWAPPSVAVGSHAVILDSSLQQLRVEPREKGFLALAVAIGFSMALAAIGFRKPRITFSWRTLAILALVVPLFNVCSGPALNQVAGSWWAFAGLGGLLALTWVAARISR